MYFRPAISRMTARRSVWRSSAGSATRQLIPSKETRVPSRRENHCRDGASSGISAGKGQGGVVEALHTLCKLAAGAADATSGSAAEIFGLCKLLAARSAAYSICVGKSFSSRRLRRRRRYSPPLHGCMTPRYAHSPPPQTQSRTSPSCSPACASKQV